MSDELDVMTALNWKIAVSAYYVAVSLFMSCHPGQNAQVAATLAEAHAIEQLVD